MPSQTKQGKKKKQKNKNKQLNKKQQQQQQQITTIAQKQQILHNTHAQKIKNWRYRDLNPGLLTCEASALPLSYIPADVSQFVGQFVFQTNKNNKCLVTTNTQKQKKWRYRDLNPGLLTCEASALPLSYIPAVVSQFVFPTCLVKQARQQKKLNKTKLKK